MPGMSRTSLGLRGDDACSRAAPTKREPDGTCRAGEKGLGEEPAAVPVQRPEWPECREHPRACAARTLVDAPPAPRSNPGQTCRAGEKGLGKGTGYGSCPENKMRPAVAVYNSPALP